ncbi:VRR-NUC domain-containing protein [Eudoraea sp.]|uniref:VRR-NUC domain-containing protein n=1 Tax=Eudoraea sp. TaxID=1979955 RepID=UPI003C76CC4E
MKESYIERKCVTLAKTRGYVGIKVGLYGWPDRLFIGPKAYVWWVEFKRPGGRPTKLQLARIATLRRLGFRVDVVDNFEVFVDAL